MSAFVAFLHHRIRSLIHLELALLVAVILCAALMAKGIGVRS